jgi:ketosteroid isomerase-like protein
VNAERFYRGFVAADRDAIADTVGEDAIWAIAGNSLLAGEHRGPAGIVALRELIARLTDGTWRPLREDSFDIAVSEHHAVIMDRFLAERAGRKLDSHEAIVVARAGCGPIYRLFHYLYDPTTHAAFWSP